MAVEVLSKKESVGILQQSKASNHWSAPAAASANFKIMQWLNAGVPNPNPDVNIANISSTSQYGTHREYSRLFVDKTSGLPTLPIAGVADQTTFAALLAMLFHSATEDASTPFEKVFTYAGTAGLPDWSGNEGYLFTTAIRQQASADDGVILQNCAVQTLNLVWDLNQRGVARCLNYNGSLISNYIAYEQTLNGTWTNATPSQAGFYNLDDTWAFSTFTIDSVSYTGHKPKRVEIQFNNNIFSDEKTTGGKANQYKWRPEINLMIRLPYNSATEKILMDYTDGARVQTTWANDVTPGLDGYFQIGMPYGVLQSPPKIYDGDYLAVDLNIQVLSAAGATPITIDMVDTIDWAF